MKAGVLGVLLIAVVTTGVAAAAEPPQAEAGLDQTAVEGTTVYLDAGGSLSPNGDITDYEWTIETPSGATTTPGCSACERTSFVPTEIGTYAVTLTVTDDLGQTDSDTMYVEVREGMTVELLSSDVVPVNESIPIGLDADRDAADLDSYAITVNGMERASGPAAGESTWIRNVTFTETGNHTLGGEVLDDQGFTATDGMTVEVVEPDESGDSSSSSSSSGGGGGGMADGDTVRFEITGTGEARLQTDYYHLDQSITMPNGEEVEFSGQELMDAVMETEEAGAPLDEFSEHFEDAGYDVEDVQEYIEEQGEVKYGDEIEQDDWDDHHNDEPNYVNSQSSGYTGSGSSTLTQDTVDTVNSYIGGSSSGGSSTSDRSAGQVTAALSQAGGGGMTQSDISSDNRDSSGTSSLCGSCFP